MIAGRLGFWLKARRRHGVHSPFVYRYGDEVLQRRPSPRLGRHLCYPPQLIRALCYFQFDDVAYGHSLQRLKELIAQQSPKRVFPKAVCSGLLKVEEDWPTVLDNETSYCILKGYSHGDIPHDTWADRPHCYVLIHWDFTMLIYDAHFPFSQTFMLR